MSDTEEEISLTINENFAKKYDHKKKREELSKLKEKYDDDEESESSTDEEEDEVGELITPELDSQIVKIIEKIKNKDPLVYDSTKNFFDEKELEITRQKVKEKHSNILKPMHLKDFHRKNLLEEAEGKKQETEKIDVGFTHVEEQKKLKEDLKSAITYMENDDDDENFFTTRVKDDAEKMKEEEEYRQFLLDSMASEKPSGWEEYKKKNEGQNIEEGEAFLMNFVLNKGWVEKETEKIPTYDEIIGRSEDEEEVDKADDFEREYNFRFEEAEGANITTYSRNIVGSVRRADDRRKKSRQSKKERKEEEKLKKQEELKRLKNLKKQEIVEKLKKIHNMAGVQMDDEIRFQEEEEDSFFSKKTTENEKKIAGFDIGDLEGDFDPNQYDSKMAEVFDDTYYDESNVIEKPDFGDDIDISDLVDPQEVEEERILKQARAGREEEEYEEENEYAENGVYEEDEYQELEQNGHEEDFIMDADYLPGGEKYGENKKNRKKDKKDKKKKKSKAEVNDINTPINEENKSEKFLDEYYQLDYEDMIGDMPTRFKYAKVEKSNFGLDPVEILLADDTQLNNVISLKKMAPYRRKEQLEKDLQKFQKNKKKRLKEFRKSLIEEIDKEILEEEPNLQEEFVDIKSLKAYQDSNLKKLDESKKIKKHQVIGKALENKKEIKKVLNSWIQKVKEKKLEGMSAKDLEEIKKKEKREKRKERAKEFKEKRKFNDIDTEDKDFTNNDSNTKAKKIKVDDSNQNKIDEESKSGNKKKKSYNVSNARLDAYKIK
ncbi:KRRI-Interacting protein 1 [Clydaea vesicula]|uniref:KRRI-Interacting protein 1 n=1 Tax=Clydaea vesicula TaxID=447962 RepID=A0AAD5TZE0_9FUNG|nr:KRRI-Interacting protein 1 [Clydaea vesicula]KAJ3377162.1 KRRI-Interacting protein 1 [Lobulomyces angularis]